MLYFLCPSCRTMLANKEQPYKKDYKKLCKMNLSEEELKVKVGELLDKYEINNMCCRMRMICTIDEIDIIT